MPINWGWLEELDSDLSEFYTGADTRLPDMQEVVAQLHDSAGLDLDDPVVVHAMGVTLDAIKIAGEDCPCDITTVVRDIGYLYLSARRNLCTAFKL